MYELFKEATRGYFQSEIVQNKCMKTVVHDKKQNVTEVRYMVEVGNDTHYTLNLYHTTSSCLGNGKGCNQFVDTDICEILSVIEQKLKREDCTMDEFNQKVRNMVI